MNYKSVHININCKILLSFYLVVVFISISTTNDYLEVFKATGKCAQLYLVSKFFWTYILYHFWNGG